MSFPVDNKTIEFLSIILNSYDSPRHSSVSATDHVQAGYSILRSEGVVNGDSSTNLSISSIGSNADHLHGSYENRYGDGDDFAWMLDSDTVALFYDEEDLEQLRRPWVKVTYFIPLVMVYGLVFLTGITGNSLVIAVLSFGRAGRCVTFPCLISMAWADNLFLLRDSSELIPTRKKSTSRLSNQFLNSLISHLLSRKPCLLNGASRVQTNESQRVPGLDCGQDEEEFPNRSAAAIAV
ncbi:hypothetical protein PoB_002167000 [Plakobranchus ocellatus]|uniref:G-protein coupled receptors family 1 profile domain-containing protein n=1 Tax=Plakobranchus ocellatus TaxID=259542 RepID=A0AAV3ZHQ8_9GAST|nr:hypothetical protein PoB_002167000 [Plakobranchus ocellatus]